MLVGALQAGRNDLGSAVSAVSTARSLSPASTYIITRLVGRGAQDQPGLLSATARRSGTRARLDGLVELTGLREALGEHQRGVDGRGAVEIVAASSPLRQRTASAGLPLARAIRAKFTRAAPGHLARGAGSLVTARRSSTVDTETLGEPPDNILSEGVRLPDSIRET